jgi:pimeloyl-ACP methyl ester carboxylesterase
MIPTAIETVFGSAAPRSNYTGCTLIVRHGFCSDHKPFVSLSKSLGARFSGATVDNTDYGWTKPVIENGIMLALHILNTYGDSEPVCLIGHSMGGLVCRVANVALREPVGLLNHLSLLTALTGNGSLRAAKGKAAQLRKRSIAGLVTLATPNSATLTYGQIAAWMKMVSSAATLGFPNKTASFVDLTTDRLFRFLQNYRVDTPALSISGSAHNRFAKKRPALGVLVGLAGTLAVPNDGLVEDRAVDLSASILPNEICHMGASRYVHLRAYPDCSDVTHSSIYDDPAVFSALAAFVERVL